jgi:arylsulfatase A-like enzyme
MDRSLGQLLEHLEALGVAQDTLVFFLGDNGGDAPLGGPHDVGSSAPLRGRKGSHYEGGMRVPFVAAWAKSDPSSPRQRSVPISPGTVQPQVAAVFDLFPTILGLAGAVAPPGHVVDGRPLDRLLTGRPDPGRAETFLMHYPHTPHRSHHFSVYREGPWKVIYHYFPRLNGVDAPVQLFDLADDPFEQADLASTRPDERRRMLRALADALARHGAQPPRDDAGRELRPTVD